jgi:predicted ribosomally synthesized peptide with SipW-like signal peptide
MVAGAAIALSVGSTGAFFSDTETSTGNTFTAGAIDLKIDNESYVTNPLGRLVFNPGTSWALADLPGHLFFNFQDVKPGDIGEDTISLHVNNNDAWACMDATLTGTPENGVNEPEALVDTTAGTQDGELQNELHFVFWADDGDNVFEDGEATKIIKEGLAKDVFKQDAQKWVLADSASSVFGSGPLVGAQDYYIGKAWCLGDMTKTPISQDGIGKTGTGVGDSTNGPLVRGTGFTCSGVNSTNITQTDGISVDVSFDVTQARHNDRFVCNQSTKLTLVKSVDNTAGGSAVATAWTLDAAGPTHIAGVTGNVAVTNAVVTPGVYNLSESPSISGYTPSAWACVGGVQNDNDTVTLAQGDAVTCTITNTFVQDTAKLTIHKVVVNNHHGNNSVADFPLSAKNDTTTTSYPAVSDIQITVPVAPGGSVYTVRETGASGNYQATFSGDCNVGTHKLTLLPNDVKSCTITNVDLQPSIKLIKAVTGTPPLALPEDFDMFVTNIVDLSTNAVPSGTSVLLESNTAYKITEAAFAGYTPVSVIGTSSLGQPCPALGDPITLQEGEAITCTITNNKI